MLRNLMPLLVISLIVALEAKEVHAQSIAELRDEGICNVGWAAGNSYGHPIWPQVAPLIDVGGEFYLGFIELKDKGESDLVFHSTSAIYDRCRKLGGGQSFNEREAVLRLQRVNDIVAQLRSVLAK